LQGMR